MWQTKYVSAVPKNLGVEVDFRQCSEDQNDFMSGKKSKIRDFKTSYLYLYDLKYKASRRKKQIQHRAIVHKKY